MGWGQWSKMAGSIAAPGSGCPDEHSDLGQPGRGGGWPSWCLALLPTPLAGPSGAHVALWEHFPAFFFFFFSTFISSDSWLLQPYGVLPTAAVQAMWHFDVSNFIFTSIDKESGRSGQGQCSPAGWPHVGPEGRAPQPRLPLPTLSSASQLFSASPAPPPTISSLCLSLSLGEKQTLHLCCSAHLGQLPRAAPTP